MSDSRAQANLYSDRVGPKRARRKTDEDLTARTEALLAEVAAAVADLKSAQQG